MILDDNNIFSETRSIIIPLFSVRKNRERHIGPVDVVVCFWCRLSEYEFYSWILRIPGLVHYVFKCSKSFLLSILPVFFYMRYITSWNSVLRVNIAPALSSRMESSEKKFLLFSTSLNNYRKGPRRPYYLA